MHGHEGCKNYTVPKTNTEFWTAKVARNRERDQETWRQLEAKVWAVIVVWECELKKARLEDTINNVAAAIIRNGDTFDSLQAARRESRALYLEERRLPLPLSAALKTEVKP